MTIQMLGKQLKIKVKFLARGKYFKGLLVDNLIYSRRWLKTMPNKYETSGWHEEHHIWRKGIRKGNGEKQFIYGVPL